MKKTSLTLSGIIILGALIITSCKKKSSDPTPAPSSTTTTTGGTTTGGSAVAGFTYVVTGGATTVADSAFYYQQYNTIHAYKSGNANHFEINLSALTVATYSIGSGTGNAVTYVMGSTYITATSGSLNITASANNKLSGNFVTPVSNGGSITEVSGRFTDIPKK